LGQLHAQSRELCGKLEAEYPQQYSWTYVESGPQVWQVEIGKLRNAA
jgi:uncharacterized protein (DUF2249 family)